MKKAFQISIAGTLFSIEEDAFARLDGYISSIKKHFASSEGSDEIVRDIESRIAEQLIESKKAVITLAEVESVIAAMGKVEDFEDGIEGEKASDKEPRKKLYRNPDDRVIAGVCSGLALYFGTDPLWIRIAFVVLTFVLNGFPLLAYIVLWIAMPEALTASQKLEMSGNPVNIGTLSENIKERVSEAEKKHGSTIRRILAAPFVALRAIVNVIRKFLWPVVKVAFAVALGLASLAGIAATSFGAPFFMTSPERLADFPILEAIPSAAFYGAVASAYIVLVVPAALLFLLSLRIVSRRNVVTGSVGLGFLGVWLLSIVGLGASVAVSVASYQNYAKTSPLFESVSREIPLDASNITEIRAALGQDVTLVQDDKVSLVATGRRNDIDSLDMAVEDGVLRLSGKRRDDFCLFCMRRAPDVTITLPSLDRIEALHGSRIEADSWKASSPLAIELGLGSEIDMKVDATELSVKAEHGSDADIEGKAKKASYDASFGSSIDASAVASDDVAAKAEFGAEIRVGKAKTLDASARNGASVRYEGEPQITEKTEFGGEVRKEGEEE